MADPSGPIVAGDPDGTDASAPTADPTEAPADAASPDEAHAATGTAPPEDAAGPPDMANGAVPAPAAPAGSVVDEPAAPPGDAEEAPAKPGPDAPAEASSTPTPLATDDLEVVERADGGDDGGDDDGGGDDDAADLDADDQPKRGRGGLLTKEVRVESWHILVGVAVVALLVGAYVIGTAQGREAGEKATSPPGSTKPGSVATPKDFVPFEDKESGIKMSIPAAWQARSTVNLGPTTRMVRAVPDSGDLMIMRVNSYAKEVTAANIGDQKAVFDAALSDQPIRLLVNEAIPTGLKLPTLVYVYQFTDEQTGVVGVHSRYIFFQGRKVVTILFQAIPEDHYKTLGPIWDSIINSLEVAPGPPPAFAEQTGATASTTPGAPADPAAPTTAAPPTTG